MEKQYSNKIHEEAIIENKIIDENSYCPICGEYDIKINSEKEVYHKCSLKTLRKLQQTRRNNNRNNKIPTPSLATQLKDGFEMWLGDQQTY